MKLFILILAITATISGVIGFTVDFAATSFLRVLFLITADIAIILLLGRFLFFSQKGKAIRQRVRVR
jgi:hypothetical protein